MRILIVGSGGREHALAWKLGQEPGVSDVMCAPGNPGMTAVGRLCAIDVSDPAAIVALADREDPDLTVIGPELPLDRGVVDHFRAARRRIFGPTRAAAQLECSKVFAKGFMARHGIPTARYRVCSSADEARALVASAEFGFPIVLKADGLAAGKGVVVAADRAEADTAICEAMENRRFGDAGSRLVIEECLSGPEVSFFTICDGTRAVPLTSAQDHKRVFDDDRGPNTGGMGAFAPSPLFDAACQRDVMRQTVEPVLRGMRAEGAEYTGFLYAGLMLTCDGPKVIEFNVRMGDPETQVLMPLIEGELAPVLYDAAEGALRSVDIAIAAKVAVGVVLCSAGYPGSVTTGVPIRGLEEAGKIPGVTIFHAGTAMTDNQLVTAGGRVLTVVATGGDYTEARRCAYEAVDRISFEGMHYRRDIGLKAIVTRQSPNP